MPSKKNVDQLRDLKDIFSKAAAIYFTKYQGLDVASMTKLRGSFFKNNIDYKVAKNSLLKIVVDDRKFSDMDEILKGDTAIAISYDEPIAPAKVMKKFMKEYKLPVIKGIIIDGEVLNPDVFDKLASMDSKEVLLSKLISMLNSPLQKFIATINAPIQNTVSVLTNLKSKS